MSKTPAATPEQDAPTIGKGRATPSRAEQEAARRRPLVADTKEARARARAELNASRDRARAGMAAGEEKYLPPRDKGPQRRFARDFVDAGWHVGELIMPLMILVILSAFLPVAGLQWWGMIGLWAYIILVIIDAVILGVRVRRGVDARFGRNHRERGLMWYAGMRSVQMRWMRLPKPQVKRGQYPA